MATPLAWPARVLADVVRVTGRLENVLNFQLAVALQAALDAVLAPALQLALVAVLCVAVSLARRWHLDAAVVHAVLVVQIGQALLRVVTDADSFVFGTMALCVPGLLEQVLPAFTASDEAQTAISVFLFSYANAMRQYLAAVDLAVSPVFLCLLALALSTWAHKRVASLTHLVYVMRAWHMIFVDLLIRTSAASAEGSPHHLQACFLLLLVIFLDELAPHELADVRGYALLRVAGELQRLVTLDSTSTLAAALLALGGRACASSLLGAPSQVLSSVSEIAFIASVNILIQDATATDADPADLNSAHRVVYVGLVAVLVYKTQALLQFASQ